MNLDVSSGAVRMTPVGKSEESRIARNLMIWINTCPGLPVKLVEFEGLAPGAFGLSVSPIQQPYVTAWDIIGGHDGEYPFYIVCRIAPGGSPDTKLQAMELLDAVGDWASENLPDWAPEIDVIECRPVSHGALGAVNDNGDEDYVIEMNLTYHMDASAPD